MKNNSLDSILKNGRLQAPDSALKAGMARKFHGRRVRRITLASAVLGVLLLVFGLFPFRQNTPPFASVDPVSSVSAFFSSDSILFFLPDPEGTLAMLADDQSADTSTALLDFYESDFSPSLL